MITLLTALLAYLIGSVSFAYLVSRALKLPDPRSYGTGELTATNIAQSGKQFAAFLALLGDAIKGGLVVGLAQLATDLFAETAYLFSGDPAEIVCAATIAALLGQAFPAYRNFRGNNTVATALGSFIVMRPVVGGTFFTIWFLALNTSRTASIGALVLAAGAPIVSMVYYGHDIHTKTVIFFSALLIWQHRANIMRLISGTEPRLDGSLPAKKTR